MHYARWKRHGTTDKRTRAGPKPLIRAGNGYMLAWAPNHPFANQGRVFEHRIVMEAGLGRPLAPEETVHHRNGDRADNRPGNLELWSSRHPKGQRVEDLVVFAAEILRLYRPDLLR